MLILDLLRSEASYPHACVEEKFGNKATIPPFMQNAARYLQNNHGVDIRHYGDMFFFNYNQLYRPTPLTNELRGLILTPARNWRVVSRGFDRFFNYKDGDEFDFSLSHITEKLDGTYIGLFCHHGRFCWQTRKTLCRDKLSDFDFTWQDLIYKALGGISPDAFQEWANSRLPNSGATYLFELVSPYNRIVKEYPESALYCLGAREFSPDTGETYTWLTPQEQCQIFSDFPVRVPQVYSFHDYSDVLSAFASFGSTDEGIVCWNRSIDRRIKIKREEYVRLHYLATTRSMSVRRLMEIVQQNEVEEVTAYFPSYKEILDTITDRYERLIAELEAVYSQIRDIESQKDFAMQATKHSFPDILFGLRSGKVQSVRDGLSQAKTGKLATHLDVASLVNL